MKTLEGMTLEEIQEVITETNGGLIVDIHQKYPAQSFPFVGCFFKEGRMTPGMWSYTGQLSGCSKGEYYLKIPADKIDWSAFPIDTLVYAPGLGSRYLDGEGGVYIDGKDSLTGSVDVAIGLEMELLEGRIMPWFGGDQPVPDDVEVEMFNHEGVTVVQLRADGVTWGNQIYGAYRLTGRIL